MNDVICRIAVLALSPCACLPELVEYEAEHLAVEHSADRRLCEGSVDYLDELIPFMSDRLGVPTPEHIRYSWLSDHDRRQFFGLRGFSRVGGVALDRHALSFSEPVLVHEVVHTLMRPHATAAFLQEGIATVYDAFALGRPIFVSGGTERPDPRPAMTLSSSELDYSEAARFVLFLLTRHGHDRFNALYQGLDRPFTMSRIRDAFRRAYDVELDDEVDLYMSGADPCEGDYFELLAARCMAAVHPWDATSWNFADILECDATGAVGGVTDHGRGNSFRTTTLEIDSPGTYEVSFVAGEDAVALLAPCFGCPWGPADMQIDRGTFPRWLAAGRYQVRVEGGPEDPARFAVVVRPVE